MTFEERVLAIKAKFQEAADELLELVSENPGAVSDIMQVAVPQRQKPNVKVRRLIETSCTGPDGSRWGDRFEVPNTFMELERRKVRRETDPVDVLVPEGRVYLSVGIWPENELMTQAYRELAACDMSPEEWKQRVADAKRNEGLYESWGSDPDLGS